MCAHLKIGGIFFHKFHPLCLLKKFMLTIMYTVPYDMLYSILYIILYTVLYIKITTVFKYYCTQALNWQGNWLILLFCLTYIELNTVQCTVL